MVFHRMNFEILSFQMVYNLWWLLKTCDGEKGKDIKTFCDKGQNSLDDVDLS